ncbi:predicted protein [Histoplasma capsulatum var. duboisii H88]|uniref:Predicted protein n=1 Tax=Ajellomyces capsulatus (strain H88) TaxID=544711 RepID=F0UNZ7_AJEC8|nr:predicted protein [Histoplasma capsulatum var. duboisii H88]
MATVLHGMAHRHISEECTVSPASDPSWVFGDTPQKETKLDDLPNQEHRYSHGAKNSNVDTHWAACTLSFTQEMQHFASDSDNATSAVGRRMVRAGRLPLSILNDEKGGGARSQAPTPKHGKQNSELVDGGAEFGSRIRGRFFHPGIPGSAGLGLRPSTTLQMVHTLARALTTGIPISKKMLPYLFRNSPIDGLVHQKSNNPPGPGRVLESKLFIATLVDDGISMGDEPHMPLRINAHNNVVVERSARTDERGFLENQRKISGTSGEIFIVPSQPGACHDANDATIPDQTSDDLLSSQAAGTKNPWNGVALKYRRIHLSSVGAVLVHRLFFSQPPGSTPTGWI